MPATCSRRLFPPAMAGGVRCARTCRSCCWPNSMSASCRSTACWRRCNPDEEPMKRNSLHLSLHLPLFLLGLAAVAWIAVVHATANPWVLAVTLLIGAAYLAGALELWRYRRASATLAAATDGLAEAPADFAAWLAGIDPSLRSAVRLRIAGERGPLPAPA